MKNFFQTASWAIVGLTAISIIFNYCEKRQSLISEGYISGTQNQIKWVKDGKESFPKETVEVQLYSGKAVDAEITDESLPFCVRYRDYPEAVGKTVEVTVRLTGRGYVIIDGHTK